MYKMTKTNPGSRLKRSNFLASARKLESSLGLSNLEMETLSDVVDACPPWRKRNLPIIRGSVKGIEKKGTETPSNLRMHVQKMLQENYPADTWIRAYTDGSAKEATTDGGGIYIEWPNGLSQRMSIPTGKYSSNYRAESEALIEAATALRNHRDTYGSKVVLLTDAKSVLHALENSKKTDHNNLKKALMDLQTSAQEVVLQWIPGHCNIFGNEVADELAKKGSELEQIHQDLNLNETKTIINAIIDKKWKETHPQYDKKDHICNLSHADQVIIFRLRCGHNRLRCHMFNCFKVGETARCECGADKQDAKHILQDCILYSDQRSAIWPTEVSLKKKLYGSCSDLRLTTEFIRTTCLTI